MARTSFSNIARTFKPNTASLGYALLLAINAAGVWGGVFPFLPMNFQTPEVMFWFFLMQSLVFSLCYLASAVGVYYFPGPTRRFMVMLASAPYLLGWCCLIGAIYLHGVAQALVIAGGSLLGLGSAGFYMLWQRLFASFDADHGNHDLILGTAYGALLYFALYAIPQAVTAFLIPLVFMPLFALAIVLKSRHIDLRQPMFEDVPREHPQVYRRVLRDYWRSALCVGAIAFCTGVMRSLAIGDPRVGSLVNLLSMTGCLVAGVGVLVLWQFKNVRMNVTNAYRIAFPLLITSFLVLPFCSDGYARWQAAILYAVYSVAIALMMIQCAQASRDRGINPVFIYGFFAGIVYALHDVGFLAGTFAEQIRVIGMQPDAVVALVAVYLLGLMFFIGQGGFKRALAASQAEDIELVAGAPPCKSATSTSAKPTSTRPSRKARRSPQQTLDAPVPAFAPSARRVLPCSKRNPSSLHARRAKLARRLANPRVLLATGPLPPTPQNETKRTTPMHPTIRTAYRSRRHWFGSITAYPHARPRSWSLSPEAIPWRASPSSWWFRKTPSEPTASVSTPSWISIRSKNWSTYWKRSIQKTWKISPERTTAAQNARPSCFSSSHPRFGQG